MLKKIYLVISLILMNVSVLLLIRQAFFLIYSF